MLANQSMGMLVDQDTGIIGKGALVVETSRRVIQMDTMKVVGILGGLAVNHPSIMALGSQLLNLYNAHSAEFNKIAAEYQTAASKATGPIDQAGVALELMAAHPDVAPLIVQILGLVQPHIPELQQTLTQLQTQVVS